MIKSVFILPFLTFLFWGSPSLNGQNSQIEPDKKPAKMEIAMLVQNESGSVSIHISGKDIEVVSLDPKSTKGLKLEEKKMSQNQHLLEVMQEMVDANWIYASQSEHYNSKNFLTVVRVIFTREKVVKKKR